MFKTVSAYSREELNIAVNKEMNDGWQIVNVYTTNEYNEYDCGYTISCVSRTVYHAALKR